MIYRFADFDLDPALYELRRNGKPVAMEPQVFNVLLHLIKNRDQIVSRDDLIALYGMAVRFPIQPSAAGFLPSGGLSAIAARNKTSYVPCLAAASGLSQK